MLQGWVRPSASNKPNTMSSHQQQLGYCHDCKTTFPRPSTHNNATTSDSHSEMDLKCPHCQGDFVEYPEDEEQWAFIRQQQQQQQQQPFGQQQGGAQFQQQTHLGSNPGFSFFQQFLSGMAPNGQQQQQQQQGTGSTSAPFTQTFHFSSSMGGASSANNNNTTTQQGQLPQDVNNVVTEFMNRLMNPQQHQRPQQTDDNDENMTNEDREEGIPQMNSFADFINAALSGSAGNGGNFQFTFGGPSNNASGYQMGDYFMGGNMDDIITRLMEQFEGPVGEPPASEKALEKVNNYTITEEDCKEELACNVCLEPFKIEDASVKEMPDCKHKFHEDCLLPWLKMHNSCPTCRHPIEDPEREKQEELHRRSASTNGDVSSENDNNGNASNTSSNNQQQQQQQQQQSGHMGGMPNPFGFFFGGNNNRGGGGGGSSFGGGHMGGMFS